MKFATLTLWLFLVSGFTTIVAVQQNLGNASIHGRILDPFGIPVPKVRVEATVLNRTQPLHTLTDEQGYYKLSDLPVGQLTLVASSPGFMLERSTLDIREGDELQLDFGLAAGYTHDAIPIEVSGTVRRRDNGACQRL